MEERIIREISDFIFVQDSPKKSDVILIAGSSSPHVPVNAAKLFLAGYAPLVLPSGRFISGEKKFHHNILTKKYGEHFKTEWDFMKTVLASSGVPEDKILKENQAMNTLENAVYSKKVLDENKISVSRAIVCCKSFHAKRCLMTYSLVFENVEILICPIDVPYATKETWFLHKKGIDKVMGELQRCGKYFGEFYSNIIDDGKSLF